MTTCLPILRKRTDFLKTSNRLGYISDFHNNCWIRKDTCYFWLILIFHHSLILSEVLLKLFYGDWIMSHVRLLSRDCEMHSFVKRLFFFFFSWNERNIVNSTFCYMYIWCSVPKYFFLSKVSFLKPLAGRREIHLW